MLVMIGIRIARSCEGAVCASAAALIPGHSDTVVVGRVIGVHIKDEFITSDGRIDILKIRPPGADGLHGLHQRRGNISDRTDRSGRKRSSNGTGRQAETCTLTLARKPSTTRGRSSRSA